MIDFVATRATTDQQTAACARLLTAVIVHAIEDATEQPSVTEKMQSGYVDYQARRAIEFLYGEHTTFPLYASLIGGSARSIRCALLQMPERIARPGKRGISAMARRTLKPNDRIQPRR
jgi:hypothetical protein